MTIKSNTLLYGFLVIASLHWTSIILTTVFEHFIGAFIPFEQLPWFRLVMLMLEFLAAAKVLKYLQDTPLIKPRQLLNMSIFAAALFLGAQFNYEYMHAPNYSGNELSQGFHDEVPRTHRHNSHYVFVIESVAIALVLIGFAVRLVFKDKNKAPLT